MSEHWIWDWNVHQASLSGASWTRKSIIVQFTHMMAANEPVPRLHRCEHTVTLWQTTISYKKHNQKMLTTFSILIHLLLEDFWCSTHESEWGSTPPCFLKHQTSWCSRWGAGPEACESWIQNFSLKGAWEDAFSIPSPGIFTLLMLRFIFFLSSWRRSGGCVTARS